MMHSSANEAVWTVIKLLDWSAEYLRTKGVEDARLNAERLLAKVLQCNRVDLYLQFDRPLSPEELSAFKEYLLRRASREPLQYVLGETEFFSLPFKIRPGVLIPRPETEILVEKVLETAGKMAGPLRIVEIGTGSGIIAVVLAKRLPLAELTATDISKRALALAQENAQIHGVEGRIRFLHQDIAAPETLQKGGPGFHIIVSNPPYIAREEAELLAKEIRAFEPAEALFAQEPMQFYKAILQYAQGHACPGGFVAVEIAPHRCTAVTGLFAKYGLTEIQVFRDLAGKERIVTGQVIKQEEQPS